MEPGFHLEAQGQEFDRLLDALVLEHSEHTREAYLRDAWAFASWMGAPSPQVATRVLVTAGPLRGNALVLQFLDAQRALGRSPATVARRLSCLKQLVRKARILGLCAWSIEIKRPRIRAYRDTRGPGVEAVHALVDAAYQEPGALGARDAAIIRLLYDLGLRRGEVAGLRMEDLERDGRGASIWIKEKGAQDRTRLSLPTPTAEALEEWLGHRGAGPGPLFYRLDRPVEEQEPLTGRAVHMAVKRLGLSIGIRCWPHGLRHTAITRVLDMTNDMRAGMRFARHRSIATTQFYDDNRLDQAGALAAALASDLSDHAPRRPR